MADLKIVLSTVLEADEKKSADRIISQLPNIEKLVNAQSKIKLQIDIAPAQIQAQVQNAINNTQAAAKARPIELNINLDNNSIAKVKEELNKLGVDDGITQKFTDQLDKMGIQIDKVNARYIDVEDSEQKILQLRIQGTDQLNRSVTVLQSYNQETQDIENTVTGITANYAQQRKEQDALAKQIASDAKARLDFVSKEEIALAKLKATYTGQSSVKPVNNADNLSKLNKDYTTLNNLLSDLKNKTEALTDAEKRNAQESIAALSEKIKKYQNLEYVATSLRTKSVSQVNTEQLSELNKYEEKLKSIGLLTDDFKERINKLKDSIEKAANSADVTSYLDTFNKLTSDVDVLNEKIRTVSSIYGDLIEVSKKATAAQSEIYKLEKTGADGNLLAEKRSELALYESQKAALEGQLTPYANILDLSKQKIKYEQQSNKNQQDLKINQEKINEALAKQAENMDVFAARINRARANLEAYGKSNSALFKDEGFSNQYKKLMDELDDVYANNDTSGFKKWSADVSTFKNEVKSAGLATKTFGDTMKEAFAKFSQWLSVTTIIMSAIRAIKEMIGNVIKLNTAMTELKKVTDETENSYNQFVSTASLKAKEIGATITDFVNATADFARLGYTLADAQQLAEVATIYSVVGDDIGSIDDATSSIISTMKAFNIQAKDSMSIVDKFNAVGNKYAISSGGIGDALTRSAAALHNAGNTIDESIALIVSANNVLQDTSKVGNMWKTVSMRIRGAKTELEEAGLETDGIAESTSELQETIKAITNIDGLGGFDILTDSGAFKSTYDIIKGIADVWDEIGSSDPVGQAALLELLAGKWNGNALAAALSNMSEGEKVLETSINSAGSALREHEKWLESVAAKTNQFKAAWESLSNTVINSDLVGNVVDTGTNVLELIEKIITSFGGVTNVLIVIAGLIATIKADSIKKVVTSLLDMTLGMPRMIGLFIEGSASGLKFADALKYAGVSASGFQLAVGAVTAIISAAVIGYNLYAQSVREAAAAQESERIASLEAAKKRTDEKQTLVELIKEYENLEEASKTDTTSRERIAEIQEEIVKLVGDQNTNIDLVNGSLETQIGLLQKAVDKQNELTFEEARRSVIEATESLKQFYKEFSGKPIDSASPINFHIGSDFDEIVKDIDLIIEKVGYFQKGGLYSDIKLFNISDIGISMPKTIDSIDEVIEYYDKLIEARDLLEEKYSKNLDYLSDSGLYKSITGEIDSMTASIEGYKTASELLEQARLTIENAENALDENGNNITDKNAETIAQYTEIINKLRLIKSEADKTGSVSSETYKNAIKDCKDFAKLLDYSEGKFVLNQKALEEFVDTLNDDYAATLSANDASDEQINILDVLSKSLFNTSRSYEDLITEIDTLSGYIDKCNSGYEFNALEILNLIQKYPELKNGIQETTNGYKLQEEAVISLIKANVDLIKSQEALKVKSAGDTVTSSGGTDKTIENINNVFDKYKKDYDKAISSWEDFITGWENYWQESAENADWVSGVKEYVESMIGQADISEWADKYIADLQKSINADTGSQKTDTSQGSKEKPQWLTDFESAYDEMNHLIDTGKKTQSEYINWLDDKYKEVFANDTAKKYLSEMWKYEEEVYKARKSTSEESLKATQDDIDEYIDHIDELYKKHQDESEYIENLTYVLTAYKDALSETQRDNILSKITAAQTDYFDNVIDGIEYEIYLLEREADTEQERIALYEKAQEELLKKKQYYLNEGYAETSDELRNIEREYNSFADSISDITEKAFDEMTENQKKSIEEMISNIEESQDAINTVLDAVVDYIKRQKDNEIDALNEQIDGIDEAYDAQKERTEDFYDAQLKASDDYYEQLIDNANEAYDAEKEALSTHYDELTEAAKDAYENQREAAENHYDELIDAAEKAYENQKEALEKSSDETIDTAEKAYDEQIDAQKKYHDDVTDAAKKAYDEEKDALEKKFDDEIDVAEKAYDTEKDNLKKYHDDIIDAAEKAYDEERDILEEKLDAETDAAEKAYDERRDSAEKYHDDIIDAAEKAYDEERDIAEKYYDELIQLSKDTADSQIKQIEDEKDAYKELIDAKINSLRASQDADDYYETVAQKNKNINSIQSEIDSLMFDDSREAQTKRLKLQEELESSKKDLNNYKEDYAVKQQIEALEEEYNAYEEIVNKKIELIQKQSDIENDKYEEQKDIYLKNLEEQHEAYIESLKADKDAALDALEEQYDASTEILKKKHEETLKVFDEQHEAYIESLETDKDAALKNLEEQHEAYIKTLNEERDLTLKAFEEQHENNMKVLKEEQEAYIASLEAEKDTVIKSLEEEKDARLKALQERHDASIDLIKTEKEVYLKSLEEQHEAYLKALENEEKANLESLERQHDKYIETLEDEKEKKSEEIKLRLEAELKEQEAEYKANVQKLENQIKDIQAYLEKEGVLRRDANELIRRDGESLWNKIIEYETDYNTNVEDLKDAWRTARAAMVTYGNTQSNCLQTLYKMYYALCSYKNTLQSMQNMSVPAVSDTVSGNSSTYTVHDTYTSQKTSTAGKYHSGGIVGGKISKKDDEILSLLEKGEMVLDAPKKNALYDLVDDYEVIDDIENYLSERWGVGIENIRALDHLTSMTPPNIGENALNNIQNNMASAINDTNNYTSNKFDNLINVTVEGNVDKDTLPSLKELLKKSADYTINQLESPLKRRGVNKSISAFT